MALWDIVARQVCFIIRLYFSILIQNNSILGVIKISNALQCSVLYRLLYHTIKYHIMIKHISLVAIVGVVLLFVSVVMFGNQHALANVYGHIVPVSHCTWLHGGHIGCVSYLS